MQEIKEIFKEVYKKELTDKESFEISTKLIGFFDLLQTIESRSKLQPQSCAIIDTPQKQTSFDNFYD